MYEWQVFFSTNTTTFEYFIVPAAFGLFSPAPVKADRAVRIQ